jgi:hypothetical protein
VRVGLREVVNLGANVLALTPGASQTAIRSPWSQGQLSTIVLSDIFGSANLPVTRAEAMSVPAVAKARHLICGLSRQPLHTWRGPDQVEDPTFLYRTNSQTPPTTRMLWTLDDLVFGGWSLWAVERGARAEILDAVRVPPERWSFNADGAVLVDSEPVDDASSVVLFSAPFEGLLEAGAATVRAARNLERAWAKRVASPVPLTELHQVNEDPLEAAEIHALTEEWAEMLDQGGGVGFTPYNIDARYPGNVGGTDLFIEGRNAVALDVGRLTSVAASLLEASLSTASLTYTTAQGTRDRFVDETAAFWLTPIEARLSMDDVVPRGQSIKFDLTDLLSLPPSGTGPVRED